MSMVNTKFLAMDYWRKMRCYAFLMFIVFIFVSPGTILWENLVSKFSVLQSKQLEE